MKYCIKIIFVLIIIVALALRLYTQEFSLGLSYDEMFSWNIAKTNGIINLIKNVLNTDYHPPFYYIILHFWINVFSDSDISLKLLSQSFSIGCLWVVYLIAKNIYSKEFGLIAMAIFAFNPLFLCETFFVRFYQMGLFFALLTILFSCKLINKPSRKTLILYLLSALLLLYTQSIGLLYLTVQITLLLIILYIKHKTFIKDFMQGMILLLFLYIPQFIMTFIQIINAKQTFWQTPWEWMNYKAFNFFCINSLNRTIFPLPASLDINLTVQILLFCTLNIVILVKITKTKKCDMLYIFLLYFLTTFLLCILNAISFIHLAPCVNYILYISHLFLLVFLISFNKKYPICLFVIAYFIVSILICANEYKIFNKLNSDYKSISNYIAQYNFKNLLVYNAYGDKYLKKYLPQIKTFDIDRDKIFTMKNWQNEANKVFDDNLFDKTIDKRKEYILNYLQDNAILKTLKTHYNKKIQSINSDDYFIIVKNLDYFDNPQDFENIIKQSEIIKNFSISYLSYLKLNCSVLKLALDDNRLENIVWGKKIDSWTVFVFKKK